MGHVILHAAALIRIRPSAYHEYSTLQLTFGQEPNIFHLKIFGCVVYVRLLHHNIQIWVFKED